MQNLIKRMFLFCVSILIIALTVKNIRLEINEHKVVVECDMGHLVTKPNKMACAPSEDGIRSVWSESSLFAQ